MTGEVPGSVTRVGVVVVASTRAAAGDADDLTGPVIVEWLRGQGIETGAEVVVPDGDPVGLALRAALDVGASVVLTTGGTGLTPTDRTPEQTRPLLSREVPGIAEALRAHGVARGVATAMLSRGVAGVVDRPDGPGCLVVNLPGSRGGVRDALEVLGPVLAHALDQLAGGDHA